MSDRLARKLLLICLAFLLVACSPAAAPTPTSQPPTATVPRPALSVVAVDQPIVNGTVTVAKVVSDGAGWIVIHAQQGGAVGPDIGHAAVKDGVNTDVKVSIDVSKATSVLYAMLHIDKGAAGTYEFPGADVPVVVDGKVLSPSFNVAGGLPQATSVAQAPVTVLMQGFAFAPKTVTVSVGTTVTWVNRDSTPHTATSDTGLWDSGILGQGQSFSFSFNVVGTFPYYCSLHGGTGGSGMAGSVVVR